MCELAPPCESNSIYVPTCVPTWQFVPNCKIPTHEFFVTSIPLCIATQQFPLMNILACAFALGCGDV